MHNGLLGCLCCILAIYDRVFLNTLHLNVLVHNVSLSSLYTDCILRFYFMVLS